jgi:hypothetical protein
MMFYFVHPEAIAVFEVNPPEFHSYVGHYKLHRAIAQQVAQIGGGKLATAPRRDWAGILPEPAQGKLGYDP